MSNLIVINSTFSETRVALIEDGVPIELYIERKLQPKTVGNIYKGRVVRVIPGMQAAFVDIGLDKAGFISAEDVSEDPELFDFFLSEDEGENGTIELIEKRKSRHPIQDILRNGQEILVQVLKEPYGTKGAKLSSNLSIAGKYLVLLGTFGPVGTSHRIENEDERKRLSSIIKRIKPKEIGFIARTASENRGEDEITRDMEFLIGAWGEIKEKAEGQKAPALLYVEPDLHIKAIRDLLTDKVEKVVVDSKDHFFDISNYISTRFPSYKGSLELYRDPTPIFQSFDLENEVKKIFEKKVWLKSGGYLIIEEAEALTVIDVNSGRYLSGEDQEETTLRINLEAAREAARQIRLRNLVGIITIDFIDIKNTSKKGEVFKTLVELLKKDRVRSAILEMSPFGVVQMTRQRVRESILNTLSSSCYYCGGSGYIKSPETVCYDIFRELKSFLGRPLVNKIIVHANPEVIKIMAELEKGVIEEIKRTHSVEVFLESKEDLDIDKFEVSYL